MALMKHWDNLQNSLAQLQFEQGVSVVGDDTLVTERLMRPNMMNAQTV